MLPYTDLAGVIFDVDDTLLDNNTGNLTGELHTRSRLAAFREVGERYGITPLVTLSLQECSRGWRDSPVHSLEGAVWTTLLAKGVVGRQEVDHSNPLLQEIVRRKNELHEAILREDGHEVPGASAFVRALAANGLQGKLAIASSAVRRDIEIFLEKTALSPLFPNGRVISKEMVTHVKPHPESFHRAFASLGLPEDARRSVLAFEDDPRGIAAAQAAGLRVFAITTGHDKKVLTGLPVPPDFVAGSYAEFYGKLGLPVTLKV